MENSSDLPSALWHVMLSQVPDQHTTARLLGRSGVLKGPKDLQKKEEQTAIWLAESSPKRP